MDEVIAGATIERSTMTTNKRRVKFVGRRVRTDDGKAWLMIFDGAGRVSAHQLKTR